MSNKEKAAEVFSPEVARQRLEAALRGARIAESKPMKSVTPKRKKAQRKSKDK